MSFSSEQVEKVVRDTNMVAMIVEPEVVPGLERISETCPTLRFIISLDR